MSPKAKQAREELRNILIVYRNRLHYIQSMAGELCNRVEAITRALEAGEPVGKLNTLFGMTDLAAKVNELSRWEGRVWEILQAAFKKEGGQ